FGPDVLTDAARRPALDPPDVNFAVPGALHVTGGAFLGGGEGSSGSVSNSSTGFPLVRLQRLDNEQVLYLAAEPAAQWSNSDFTSIGLTDSSLPFGYYRMSVIANGIASTERILNSPYRPIRIDLQTPPNGEVTLPYSYQPTTTGGFGATTWTLTGLPSGLTYSTSTGLITGTPTISGPVTLTVSVTDAQGLTDSRTLNTFTIYAALTITTLS